MRRLSGTSLKRYLTSVDLEALANLPPPGVFFERARFLQSISSHLFSTWRHLATHQHYEHIDIEVSTNVGGVERFFYDEDAVAWVITLVALYYHHAPIRLLETVGTTSSSQPPGFDLDMIAEIGNAIHSSNPNTSLRNARLATYNYFYAVIGSFVISSIRVHGPNNSLLMSLESAVHNSIRR
jgi:hypothetical protein